MNRMFLVFLIVLVDFIGFGLVIPTMPFVARNFGASDTIVTIIIGLYSVGLFFTTPFWGRFSDRVGRRPVLMFSTLGLAASYAIIALSPNLMVLAVGRIFGGLMAGNVSAATAYISDITAPEDRAKGMGMIGAAIGIGFIIGPGIGGLLGGADAASASLFLPAMIAAGAALLNAVGIYFFLPESLDPEHRKAADANAEAKPGRFAALKSIWRRPTLRKMIIMVLLFNVAAGLFELAIPLWTADRLGWGPSDLGKALVAAGVVMVIIQGGLMGPLVKRFGERRLMATGAVVYGSLLLVVIQSATTVAFIATLCAIGAMQALFNSPLTSMISKRAGDTERGLVMGVQQSMVSLARVVGPVMSGFLYQYLDPDAPMMVGAVFVGLCLILYLTVKAAIAKGEAAERAEGFAGHTD